MPIMLGVEYTGGKCSFQAVSVFLNSTVVSASPRVSRGIGFAMLRGYRSRLRFVMLQKRSSRGFQRMTRIAGTKSKPLITRISRIPLGANIPESVRAICAIRGCRFRSVKIRANPWHKSSYPTVAKRRACMPSSTFHKAFAAFSAASSACCACSGCASICSASRPRHTCACSTSAC